MHRGHHGKFQFDVLIYSVSSAAGMGAAVPFHRYSSEEVPARMERVAPGKRHDVMCHPPPPSSPSPSARSCKLSISTPVSVSPSVNRRSISGRALSNAGVSCGMGTHIVGGDRYGRLTCS